MLLTGFLLFLVTRVTSQALAVAPRRCEGIFKRIDCWGPSDDSPDNICMWNSGDGECNPESNNNMEKLCETFMQQTTCNNRDGLCVWNPQDFKCQNDEGEAVNGDADSNYFRDCSQTTLQGSCRGYAGRGQECRWVASTGTCANGYFGNMDLHCGAFDGSNCQFDSACIMDAGVCVSREGHPNSGANTVPSAGTSSGTTGGNNWTPSNNEVEFEEPEEPEEPEESKQQEAESPTLEKGKPLLTKERDYTAGFWFLGVCGAVLLFGAVVKVLFYHPKPTSPTEEALCEDLGPEPILLNDGSALII